MSAETAQRAWTASFEFAVPVPAVAATTMAVRARAMMID
jgi:hypothetical protein